MMSSCSIVWTTSPIRATILTREQSFNFAQPWIVSKFTVMITFSSFQSFSIGNNSECNCVESLGGACSSLPAFTSFPLELREGSCVACAMETALCVFASLGLFSPSIRRQATLPFSQARERPVADSESGNMKCARRFIERDRACDATYSLSSVTPSLTSNFPMLLSTCPKTVRYQFVESQRSNALVLLAFLILQTKPFSSTQTEPRWPSLYLL
mmetsp:Transcript_100404/g.321993  ORF Transcript_100404/g.321993 Transcript_100404/m.321993 type:complete len:213 (-) Transcript_100404:4906-5544(-)